MTFPPATDQSWAILIARLVLGLIFGMAGWGKVFTVGPAEHAHRYFVDPYAATWTSSCPEVRDSEHRP